MQPPKFEVAPEAKPVPVQKPKPEAFDINNIKAMLDRRQAAGRRRRQGRLPERQGLRRPERHDGPNLRAMLQSEIYKCWSPPVGVPHPENLIVSYELFLNRDGFRRTTAAIDGRLGGSRGERSLHARSGGIGAAPPFTPARRTNCLPTGITNGTTSHSLHPRDMMGQ